MEEGFSCGYSQTALGCGGFRATASTLLNQTGLWNPDAIERQLGHIEGNDIRRAYMRGEYWDERVRMMAWYLAELRETGKPEPVRVITRSVA